MKIGYFLHTNAKQMNKSAMHAGLVIAHCISIHIYGLLLTLDLKLHAYLPIGLFLERKLRFCGRIPYLIFPINLLGDIFLKLCMK